MSQIDKTKKEIERQAVGFLSGKPIWVWWIAYTSLVGLLFGVFYFIWTLITKNWWAIAMIILTVGIVWSTISYYNQKPVQVMPEPDEQSGPDE